jgi:glycosyltransferase involved in cell wall biosynthesis
MSGVQLTVCIPIYECKVNDLVSNLLKQAATLPVPASILLVDDASTEKTQKANRPLAKEPKVTYQELPENVGRSTIRNYLAKQAQGRFILFLDCDSKIPNPEFLSNYWNQRVPNGVVCGGTLYPAKATYPYALHNLYGQKRENTAASNSAHSFHSNNFLIDKALFAKVTFNQELKQYGHEDTLFGWELHQLSIPVKRIKNPVIHHGLENARQFILKTEQALENLLLIAQKYPQWATQMFKLFRLAKKLNSLGLARGYGMLFKFFKPLLLANLLGKKPNLRLFDLYRLGYLLQLRQGTK